MFPMGKRIAILGKKPTFSPLNVAGLQLWLKADTGQTWTAVGGTFKLASNQLVPNSNNDGDISAADIGKSNYKLTAYITPYGNNGNRNSPGILFRYSDASNFYLFSIYGAGNYMILYKRTTATGYVNLREFTQHTIPSGVQIKVEIYCKDDTIAIFVDGTEFVTLTGQTFNQTATKIGVRLGKTGAPASLCQWDSIACTPVNYPRTAWAFTRNAGNPLIVLGAGGSWEDVDIANPDIFHDTPNNRWCMNYSGYDGAQWHTGLAYSNDLLSWTKEAANPILSPIAGDGYIAGNGAIVLKGSTYYLYYNDQSGNIKLATSPDLATWTRQGVVIAAGAGGTYDSNGCFDPTARLMGDGTTVEIFYAGQNAGGLRGIGRATSTDGTTFTKQGKLFDCPAWSSPIAYPGEPHPIEATGASYSILIDTGEYAGMRYCTRAYTTDSGATWNFERKIFDTPTPSVWDSAQVFDPCPIVSGGTLYLFYAGSTRFGNAQNLTAQIGLATLAWP